MDRQNIEEDENIDLNIEQVCREGDLSPRHMGYIKGRAKKETKPNLPLK